MVLLQLRSAFVHFFFFLFLVLLKYIRILKSCEVRIENSITRVTVRHHEACLCLCFSCILFLRQVHLSLNLRCFMNKTISRTVWFGFLTPKRLEENDVKTDAKCQNDILMSYTRVVLHPPPPHHHPRVRRHFLAPVSPTESPVRYARRQNSSIDHITFYIWAMTRQNVSSGFPTRPDTNWPAQPQKLASVLKFRL